MNLQEISIRVYCQGKDVLVRSRLEYSMVTYVFLLQNCLKSNHFILRGIKRLFFITILNEEQCSTDFDKENSLVEKQGSFVRFQLVPNTF